MEKYNNLLLNHGSHIKISYLDLLLTEEWTNKRKEIIIRDGFRCRNCYNLGSDETYFDAKTGKSEGYSFTFEAEKSPTDLESIYHLEREFKAISKEEIFKIEIFYNLLKSEMNSFKKDFHKVIEKIKEPLASNLRLLHLINNNTKPDEIEYGQIPTTVNTNGARHLHVHHLYYVLSRLPWEYSDQALITLCNLCHWDLHQKTKIKVFKNESNLVDLGLTACKRCNGAGVFQEYQHIQNGICFECHGRMYYELITK